MLPIRTCTARNPDLSAAQGLDRVHARREVGGVDAEADADGHRARHRHDPPHERHRETEHRLDGQAGENSWR